MTTIVTLVEAELHWFNSIDTGNIQISLPRAICEHWRACKQSFHQKSFCRYIYRRESDARKKIQLQTTNRKIERFIYKRFLLERDVCEPYRACKQIFFCRCIYRRGSERLKIAASIHTRARAKV